MLSVILKTSVRGLGKAGEVAEVRPGYARYLLAGNKAVRATRENLAVLEGRLSAIKEENDLKLAKAQEVGKSLSGECLVIIKQASDDGKLFGSVTVRDIAKLLCSLGYDVQPKEVFFSGAIKRIGEYEINVELHADLVVVVKLHVVKNEAEAESARLNAVREHKEKDKEDSLASEASLSGESSVPAPIEEGSAFSKEGGAQTSDED